MKLLCFLTFGFFLKMYIFEIATFYLAQYLSNQLNFLVVVCIYQNHVFDQAFFLLAINAMITEKMHFPYFHGNLCKRKIPSSNHAACQSRLSLKKIESDKIYGRKIVTKVYLHKQPPEVFCKKRCSQSFYENRDTLAQVQPITKIRDHSNRFKMDQYFFFYFYYHLLSCSSKGFVCCLTCVIFLKSS